MIFDFLKKKKEQPRKADTHKAVIFIDHDHWYVSLNKQFRVQESVKMLMDSLASKYDVTEVFAFGDFVGRDKELGEIAEMTENIYDVRGDMKIDKDVLMLDSLYRCGVKYKGTNTTVIIVSGSGRLTLAVRFIKEECGLKVNVYGVRGCISGALKETADAVFELPNDEYIAMLFPLVIQNCVHVSKNANIIPTHKTTIEAVSSYNDISPVLVETAVNKMLELGYLYKKMTVIASFNTVKTIAAKWELLIRDGLYDPEKDY